MTMQETNLKNISINTFKKKLNELGNSKQRKQQLYDAKEWYTIRALLGNQ